MKKNLLILAALISTIAGVKAQNTRAQAPDFGFENWDPIPLNSLKDPRGWASLNGLNLLGMTQTVFEETTAPYAGNKSAKVVTEILPPGVSIANPFAPGQMLDTIGVLGIGETMMQAPYAKYGYPYTSRSATLSFACKYNPNPNNIPGVADTAFVFSYLTKWNGTSRDYIAAGFFKTSSAISSWTPQSISMIYNPLFNNVLPDSQQIFVSSSIYIGSGAKKGSAFYIDGLQWSGWVSTGEINGQAVEVKIYPNPATSYVNFKTNVDASKINVMDVTGRLMGTYDLIDNKVNISTENYASGIYFYQILNNNNEIINRDKFEVVK